MRKWSALILFVPGLLFAESDPHNVVDLPDLDQQVVKAYGSARLASDYFIRGINQTDNGPAAQLVMGLESKWGLYAQAFGSNVNITDSDGETATTELSTTLGIKREFSGVSTNFQLNQYSYPKSSGLSFKELIGSATYKIVTLMVGYSDDVFASGEEGVYSALSVAYPLPEKLLPVSNVTVGGHVGSYDFSGTDFDHRDYADYGVFVAKRLADDWETKLTWTGTDGGFDAGSADDDTVYVSLSRNF